MQWMLLHETWKNPKRSICEMANDKCQSGCWWSCIRGLMGWCSVQFEARMWVTRIHVPAPVHCEATWPRTCLSIKIYLPPTSTIDHWPNHLPSRNSPPSHAQLQNSSYLGFLTWYTRLSKHSSRRNLDLLEPPSIQSAIHGCQARLVLSLYLKLSSFDTVFKDYLPKFHFKAMK